MCLQPPLPRRKSFFAHITTLLIVLIPGFLCLVSQTRGCFVVFCFLGGHPAREARLGVQTDTRINEQKPGLAQSALTTMVRAVAVAVLLLVSTTVSLVCSVLTVALIRSSKRWNGYVLIVYWMSLCQATFDVSYYLLAMIYTTNSQGVTQWLIPLYLLTNIVGGLSTALWTMVIATITGFVVFTMRSFNIYKNFTALCLLTTVPPLAIAIGQIALAFSPQGTNGKADVELMWGYYWLRIACIAYNFVVCCLCIAVSSGWQRCGGGRWGLGAEDQTQVHEAHIGSTSNSNSNSSSLLSATPAAGKQNAIRTLSQQMLLYPLAQTVTRFGAAWYELVYGFSAPSLNDFSNMPPAQSVAACFWAVLSPSAGIAYFAVYLVMQPVARKKLVSWIDSLRCWGSCSGDDGGADIFVGGGGRDDIREELLASHPDDHTVADEEQSGGGGRLSSGILWSRGAATSQVVTINLSDQEQIEPPT